MENAACIFTVAHWDQADMGGLTEGQPLTRVSAVFEAEGDLKGRFLVSYLMYTQRNDEQNPHNAQACYTGYLLFDGAIGEKAGQFALEDHGVYADSSPRSTLTVVEDSGSGDFTGLTGAGQYYAAAGKMVLELTYALNPTD